MVSQDHQRVACLCVIQLSFSVKSSSCVSVKTRQQNAISFLLRVCYSFTAGQGFQTSFCLWLLRTQSRHFILIIYFSLEQRSHFSLCFFKHHMHCCHKTNNKISTLNKNKLISVLLPRLRFKKLCDTSNLTGLLGLLFSRWINQVTSNSILNTNFIKDSCKIHLLAARGIILIATIQQHTVSLQL